MGPSSHSREEALPSRFGEFLLFDKIGQGGMAEIFLAKELGTLGQQRLTVIKRVLPVLSADPQFAEMLVDEAKLCASLNHKNVVQVTDLGRIDEQLYIAMEYVEGFDLNDLLRRCTRNKIPMPAEFIFLIIEETLRALDYAHRATDDRGAPLGIIHRDVSPTNVLISCEGEVKLCDFGIARAAARDGTLPQGVLKGKFAYMSPEQARGDEFDQRSDLFAAGILLWEMVAGRRLYKGDAGEVLVKARVGATSRIPDRGLPRYEALAAVASRALSAEPEGRYQTAKEMLEDIGDYVHEAGLFASQLRFARFLQEHFGEDLQRQRRGRERASMALVSPTASPAPAVTASSKPAQSPTPEASATPRRSPAPLASPAPHRSPSPSASPAPRRSPSPSVSPAPLRSPAPQVSPTPQLSPPPKITSVPKLEIVPESSPPPTSDDSAPTPIWSSAGSPSPAPSSPSPRPATSSGPDASPMPSAAVPADPPWASEKSFSPDDVPRPSARPPQVDQAEEEAPLPLWLWVGVGLVVLAGLLALSYVLMS